jgi:thiol-disulfide isomerase/thioredoxin
MGRLWLACVVLLSLAGCARHRGATPAPDGPASTAPVADGSLPGGAVAPGVPGAQGPVGFTVQRLGGGERFDIASERGNVVLLDVWATWCEPCRETLPYYDRLARELGPRGLKVYAMSIDEDARAVAAFVKETGLTLPVLLDANATVAERTLRVQAMPTSFLLDRSGAVRQVHEGVEETALALYTRTRAEVERLLAEPAPAAAP